MNEDVAGALKKFQKELSAGTVSLALLCVLGRARQPMYGYQIAKRLEAAGEGVLAGKQSALYEPIHGSAPDIAGKGLANPIASILSLAMAFRYSFGQPDNAARIEKAVDAVLAQGFRTGDIMQAGMTKVGTAAMTDAILKALDTV